MSLAVLGASLGSLGAQRAESGPVRPAFLKSHAIPQPPGSEWQITEPQGIRGPSLATWRGRYRRLVDQPNPDELLIRILASATGIHQMRVYQRIGSHWGVF